MDCEDTNHGGRTQSSVSVLKERDKRNEKWFVKTQTMVGKRKIVVKTKTMGGAK
jgi:hypothetical protein